MKFRGVAFSNHNRRRKFSYKKMSSELAYLIGVYLGDGSVCHNSTPRKGHNLNNSFFQLSSIDKDFIEESQRNINVILGYKPNFSYIEKNRLYLIRVCSTDFAKWLCKITNNKKKVPEDILNSNNEIKKHFLRGLLDSEGSISKDTYGSYKLYFAVKDRWINSIKIIFEELGIKTNPIRYTSGIPRFIINIFSFYRGNIKFSIKRKQIVIERYIKERGKIKPE